MSGCTSAGVVGWCSMTTQPDTPSVRERQLARELREARVGAQLPGSETARILGWSASKVSRIETGRIGISPTDLDRLLDLYQVPDEQARYLRRLAPAARTRLRPPGGHGHLAGAIGTGGGP